MFYRGLTVLAESHMPRLVSRPRIQDQLGLKKSILDSGFQVPVHGSVDIFSQTHMPRLKSCPVLYLAYCDDVGSITALPYLRLSQDYMIPENWFPYPAKYVLEENTK